MKVCIRVFFHDSIVMLTLKPEWMHDSQCGPLGWLGECYSETQTNHQSKSFEMKMKCSSAVPLHHKETNTAARLPDH